MERVPVSRLCWAVADECEPELTSDEKLIQVVTVVAISSCFIGMYDIMMIVIMRRIYWIFMKPKVALHRQHQL